MYKSKCNIQSKVKPEHTKAKDFLKNYIQEFRMISSAYVTLSINIWKCPQYWPHNSSAVIWFVTYPKSKNIFENKSLPDHKFCLVWVSLRSYPQSTFKHQRSYKKNPTHNNKKTILLCFRTLYKVLTTGHLKQATVSHMAFNVCINISLKHRNDWYLSV